VRTTLTLDDDVAVRLEELREKSGGSFKEAVNRALRAGLDELQRSPARKKRPFRTRPVSGGRCLVPSLDDITAVLDLAEGPPRLK
jgi:hypothetical protein